MTLIALEECYVQDKVTNLPLFLRLFDQTEARSTLSASNNLELLSAYKAFMANAETQFAFIKQSPQILPKEMAPINSAEIIVDASFLQTLSDYVKSNATSFLISSNCDSSTNISNLSYIAKILDPATLQITKLALSRAYD